MGEPAPEGSLKSASLVFQPLFSEAFWVQFHVHSVNHWLPADRKSLGLSGCLKIGVKVSSNVIRI